jgi:exodeoxyribonuclease-3
VSRTKLDTHPRLRTEEPHAQARAELNAQLHDFVDIWRERNPEARGYTWFNPRSRSLDAARIDYFLVSRDAVVRDAAILPRHAWSDHAPLTLDVAPGSAC